MNPDGGQDPLEVERLLESSRPLPRLNLTWLLLGGFLIVLLLSEILGNKSPAFAALASIVWTLGLLALMAGTFGLSVYTVRKFRGEQRSIERIGELVQLRRWSEATTAACEYLSTPARTSSFRAQALLYLSSILARFQRFEDAILIQNHLINEGVLDPASNATVRIGRAMSMLREDHLFDADRAINEIRRGPAGGSGPALLVELYRDVRTGHPNEAVELFERNQTVMRDQLGHRVADAYALAARAYDLLGKPEQASADFLNATLLAAPTELFRRYPEVEKLSGRYAAAPLPQDLINAQTDIASQISERRDPTSEMSNLKSEI